METKEGQNKAVRELEQRYQQVIERLLEQEEVENYFYEFRYEATPEHPVRYVVRTYPLWLEGLEEHWENMRRLYEKGYAFFYRETRELIYDISSVQGLPEVERTVDSRRLFLALIPSLIIHAMEVPAEEAEWLCRLLNGFQTEAMAIESTFETMESAIHNGLRRKYFPSPLDYRGSSLPEELKPEFAKRLPGYYRWLFSGEEAAAE